ncbi:hypothetical protein AVEN_171415-1 [Araneus ventricosus]|uniref:Uncharacterized protein n=1 Tax=Araneus ventricosus TaxID=182803 RepID=A0A4Y2D478_ARAVE|nr:hypothetical protein AVEN_171415-1 [Araneus ventricosus]
MVHIKSDVEVNRLALVWGACGSGACSGVVLTIFPWLKITSLSPNKKRLRNIADNADRKAHNLYLNHTQATPNAEYVHYDDEETHCSSDIDEVILNLNTYKPSTWSRLISLTDPKYKQLTPFVAKSSQMRLGLPSTPVLATGAASRTWLWLQLLQVFFTVSGPEPRI